MNRVWIDTYITDQDRKRTGTLHMLRDLELVLAEVNSCLQGGERLLDIGCGFGGLGMIMRNHLGIKKVYGVDVDPKALSEASRKGMEVCQWDINQVPLPYPSEHFDLVTSFGVLDYLPWFDGVLGDMYRILKPGGYSIISLPNLASWNNRLFLLLGYQPRDIEVSEEKLVGVHPSYRHDDRPTRHIHAITTRAFRELMEHLGFCTICVRGGRPLNIRKPFLVDAIDWLLGKSPLLARRFFYAGQKPLPSGTRASEYPGWPVLCV